MKQRNRRGVSYAFFQVAEYSYRAKFEYGTFQTLQRRKDNRASWMAIQRDIALKIIETAFDNEMGNTLDAIYTNLRNDTLYGPHWRLQNLAARADRNAPASGEFQCSYCAHATTRRVVKSYPNGK